MPIAAIGGKDLAGDRDDYPDSAAATYVARLSGCINVLLQSARADGAIADSPECRP